MQGEYWSMWSSWVTASDVLAKAPGADRDAAIDAWCASVWESYRDARPAIMEWLARNGIAPRALLLF